jgi:hypothetical protein
MEANQLTKVDTLIEKTTRMLTVIERHIGEENCSHGIKEIMKEALQ